MKNKIRYYLPIALGFGMILLVSLSNYLFAFIGLVALIVYLLETKVKSWNTNNYFYLFLANALFIGLTSSLSLPHTFFSDLFNILGFSSLVVFIAKKLSSKLKK